MTLVALTTYAGIHCYHSMRHKEQILIALLKIVVNLSVVFSRSFWSPHSALILLSFRDLNCTSLKLILFVDAFMDQKKS